MTTVILRRALTIIPTLIGVAVVLFLVLRVLPSDPAAAILGDHATESALANLRARLGLDKPIHIQFADYFSSLLKGDLGNSYRTGRPVLEMISFVFPHTLLLALASVLFATVVGIPLGIMSSQQRGKLADHVVRVVSLFGISVPVFYLGILLLLLFVLKFPVFPLSGAGPLNRPFEYFKHLVLPMVALGLTQSALIMRMTRASMLDVAELDYVRTARAKGVAQAPLLWRHIFRNAMLPVVTIIGLDFGALLAGTVLTESVFNRPGIGLLLVDAIRGRDYPVTQGLILLLTLLITIVNLLVDVLYSLINPRITYR
jgi:ABC-type dipeptide/oligopeptide/nickel transport system permease component